MGATSRRKVSLPSAACRTPVKRRKDNTGGLLRGMSGTSGYFEWNRAGNHYFLAVVRAETAVDIHVVEAGVGCLGGGHGKTAGGHVDHTDVFGANDIHVHLFG